MNASLADDLFLLTFNPETGRARHVKTRLIVNAGLFAELVLGHHLEDQDGKPVVSGGSPSDPAAATVLQEVESSRPRRWSSWIGKRRKLDEVRDRMVARGTVTVTPAFFGLGKRYLVEDVSTIRALCDRVAIAYDENVLVHRVPAHDRALAALAVAGGMSGLKWKEKRRLRARISELGEPIAPVPGALKKAIDTENAAASS